MVVPEFYWVIQIPEITGNKLSKKGMGRTGWSGGVSLGWAF